MAEKIGNVWIFIEQEGGKIADVSLELVCKGKELADRLGVKTEAVLLGNNVESCCQTLFEYGCDTVLLAEDPRLEPFTVLPFQKVIMDLIREHKPNILLFGATLKGRELAPRVASEKLAGLTADCTVLEMKENPDLVQIRPAFGGNIMAQIITPNTRPQFCTARYKVFTEPQRIEAPCGEIVNMSVTPEMLISGIEVLSSTTKPKDIDIAEAEVIVAVGRGACSEAMRSMAQELADLLGGVVACTRPLVENNMFDAKHQIGLSGRTVKPKLIICLGISGSVQFAAGMKSSDCIVAVNTDASASIFDVAHYCVVGDAPEIAPKLIAKIKEGV